MNTQMATDEYIQALKAGQKEYKELTAAGAKNEYFVCGGLHGVHAGALACHIGPGKKAAERALSFVKEAFCRNSAKN